MHHGITKAKIYSTWESHITSGKNIADTVSKSVSLVAAVVKRLTVLQRKSFGGE